MVYYIEAIEGWKTLQLFCNQWSTGKVAWQLAYSNVPGQKGGEHKITELPLLRRIINKRTGLAVQECVWRAKTLPLPDNVHYVNFLTHRSMLWVSFAIG